MSRGIHLGLSRITSLLSYIGNPHLAVPIIHVAGTNGKGSVCAYLDSALRASGLNVGRFTSPHLIEPRDCISVAGAPISREAYKSISNLVEEANRLHGVNASSFEVLTAIAFEAFRRSKPPLDVAVIEVGMGGATDATNVCPQPLATVVSAIDLDDQGFLGNTVEEIATVKAGIVKHCVPCVLAEQAYPEATTTVERICKSAEAPLLAAHPVEQDTPVGKHATLPFDGGKIAAILPLPGRYQLANATAAITTLEILMKTASFGHKITARCIVQGLEATRWPGRLDWVQINGRQVLVDGAHNPASMKALRAYLNGLEPTATAFILALSAPRDPEVLLDILFNDCEGQRTVVATGFSEPEGMPWVRSADPDAIVAAARKRSIEARFAKSLQEALEALPKEARVVICGSLYLVSDVYRLITPTN